MSYSFKKQLKSFTFAWKGILTCAGHEQNITFHLIAAIIVLAAGFCFGIALHWHCDSSRAVQFCH